MVRASGTSLDGVARPESSDLSRLARKSAHERERKKAIYRACHPSGKCAYLLWVHVKAGKFNKLKKGIHKDNGRAVD